MTDEKDNALQTLGLRSILNRVRYNLNCTEEDNICDVSAKAGLAVDRLELVEKLLRNLVEECEFSMKKYKALREANLYLKRYICT